MEEYFSSEIKRTSKELINLKTASQKSAGVIPTIAQTVSIQIPLSLSDDQLSASGSAFYKITIQTNALIFATLDKYYDDITKLTDFPATTRSFDLLQNKLNATDYIIYIYAHGDGNDRSTLSGGGSVSLSGQLTIRSTAEFTVEEV